LKGRSAKQKTKRRLTFNLLPLHLESAALGLDRAVEEPCGRTKKRRTRDEKSSESRGAMARTARGLERTEQERRMLR
jgi:hypothetical protein